MLLKLLVKETADPGEPAEYLFEHERVSIGRGNENHLTLTDPSRIVSHRHAEVRREGAALQLVDLGSKNFTYLGEERLEPERPYPVRSGDAFHIGPFKIEVAHVEETAAERMATAPDVEQTLFAASFVNPFEEDAEALASALQRLRDTYDATAVSQRADALRDVLREALPGGQHAADPLIAQFIGDVTDTAAPSASSDLGVLQPKSASREPAAGPEALSISATPVSHDSVGSSQRERLLDVLLGATGKLVGLPWQFRHEFIGQTIMQSSEAAFLYEGDAQTLGRYLLGSELSDEHFEHRLSLLKEALSSLGLHHVAMVEGYKAAAREGAQQLTRGLRPASVEEEVRQECAWYAALPLLMDRAVVARLRHKAEELAAGDWSVAERRVYRPAFIRAYLARMTSVRGNCAPEAAALDAEASRNDPKNDPSKNEMTW